MLTKYDPMNKLFNADSLFDLLYTWPKYYTETTNYSVDFYTYVEGEDLVLETPIPGFSKDEVDVYIDKGVLVVESGVEEADNKSAFRKSFTKRYRLPKKVASEEDVNIKATMDKGVLRVVFTGAYKKLKPGPPKRIPIEIT